jgi:hypothetical protein
MPVTVGDAGAILSGGVGRLAPLAIPSPEEVLTRGHWTGVISGVFPPEGISSLGSVEILYPIQPMMDASRMVYRTDSLSWKVVNRSENKWRHELVTLNYRVHRNAFPEFYDALLENKGSVLTLNTPGVQPFIRSDETNQVFVTQVGRPIREKEFHWRIAVTFLRDPNSCFLVYDALDTGREISDWEANGQIADAGGLDRFDETLDQKNAGAAPRSMDCNSDMHT